MRVERGGVILEDGVGAPGIFIVVNGIIRVTLDSENHEAGWGAPGGAGGEASCFFFGMGGVVGLVHSFMGLKVKMPGEGVGAQLHGPQGQDARWGGGAHGGAR